MTTWASRYLQAIRAFNPNHDELGRFAEGDATGGGRDGASKDRGSRAPARGGELRTASEIKSFGQRNGLDTFKASLSEKESDTATNYQGPAFDRFNSSLRGTDNYGYDDQMQAIMEDIKTLDNVIAKAPPLKEPVMVFRAFNDKKILDQIKAGATFTDKAFVSTTFDKSIAKSFQEQERIPGQVLLAIRLPAGTKGLSMKGSSGGVMDHQQEFVLPREAKFRIAKVQDRPDGTRLALLDYVGSSKNPEEPTFRGSKESRDAYRARRGIKARATWRERYLAAKHGDAWAAAKFSYTAATPIEFDDEERD
jgi:hypothetical protein